MTATLVRTPQHFAALLVHGDDVVRRAAQQLLVDRDPDALSFARASDSMATSALAEQLNSTIEDADDMRILEALVALEDPLSSDELMRVLTYSQNPDALDLAAEGLARVKPEWLASIMQDRSRTEFHALAAEYLEDEGLPATDAVRAALARIRHHALDPLATPAPASKAILDVYERELRGPYAEEARRACEAHGALAFDGLAPRIQSMNAGTQVWMMAWCSRLRTLPALNLLDAKLQDPETSDALLEQVLLSIAQLGPFAATFQTQLLRLRNRIEFVGTVGSDATAVPHDLHAALAAATAAAEGGAW